MTDSPFEQRGDASASSTSTPAARPQVSSLKPVDPIKLLRRNVWILLIATVVGGGLGVGTWLFLNRTMPSYQSDSKILVTGGLTDAYANPNDPLSAGSDYRTIEASMRNQINIFMSNEVISRALDTGEIQNTQWYGTLETNTERRDQLRDKMLSAGLVEGSTFINVSVRTKVPGDAKIILDTLMRAHSRFVDSQGVERNDLLRRALGESQARAQLAYEQARDARDSYARMHGISQQTSARLDQREQSYLRLNDDVATLEGQYQAAIATLQSLRQPAGEDVASGVALQVALSSPAVSEIDRQVRQLEQQLMLYIEELGPRHDVVRDLRVRVANLQDEREAVISEEVLKFRNGQIEQATQQVQSLGSQLQERQRELENARSEVEQLRLHRDQLVRLITIEQDAKEKLDRLTNLLDEIQVQISRPDSARIQTPFAATDARKVFPQPMIVVPGITLAVLGLTFGLLFVRELLDQRIKAPTDLGSLGRGSIMGVIPDVSEDPSSNGKIENAVIRDPNGLMAEAFRQARTSLCRQIHRDGHRSIMLTCAQEGTGTSALIGNLAASLSLQEKRVLVVDANLRRSKQHALHGMQPVPGLVEVVRGENDLASVIQHFEEGGYDVVTAGAAGTAPPELLESSGFKAMLDQAYQKYDIVLIDTPPALIASDAHAVASVVDAALVVVRAPTDKRGMVGRLMRQLEADRAAVLGVLLNGVRSDRGGYFRENYRRFYKYQAPQRKGA